MKKTILLLGIAFIALTSFAQNKKNIASKKESVQGVAIKVKDWTRVGLIFDSTFFNPSKEQIISQIGNTEFEKAIKKVNANTWPMGFYMSHVPGYQDRLNRLKLFKMATFKHVFNGKDHGNFLIIKAPANENKDWDKEITWDGDVYMVIRENATEILH